MTLFSATIEGFELTPKIRLPIKMKWSKQGQRYLKMKEDLAWKLREHYQGMDPLAFKISMSCAIHLKHRRRIDIDNLIGAVMDALQYRDDSKGIKPIILDDRQIKEFKKVNLFQGNINRIVVSLRRL